MKNINFKQVYTKKSAVALIMALYIIIVFVVLGLALTGIMATVINFINQDIVSLQALYIAEGGLEYALCDLMTDEDWSDNTSYTKNITFSDGKSANFNISFQNQAETSTDIISEGEVVSPAITPSGNVTGKRQVEISVGL